MGWLIAIIAAYLIIFWIVSLIRKFIKAIHKYNQADIKVEEGKKLWKEITAQTKQLERDKTEFDILLKEKSQGFPWLAGAVADHLALKTNTVAEYLARKPHPAYKSAELVRGEAKRRRVAEKQARIAKYLLEYYESLFPWLVDFKGEDLDDLVKMSFGKQDEKDEQADPVSNWLTPSEYNKLSVCERNQKALDRYWQRKKAKWEIGRDYERYIGYLYEKNGYDVIYHGIEEGLADLGRDLLAIKSNEIVVIQCKYWSQEKTIHEKHICQFKGTMLKYMLEQPGKNIIGRFITSTKLSDVAREFAKALEIEIQEQFSFQEYPAIKCNISKRTGERIYHLPFDQQYDRTIVEEERSEGYVKTVAEAESLGFRRAFKWRGDKEVIQYNKE